MPIGSTNVYNSGDLILSTVSGSGTSFIETKIASATSSLILFNSSGTLTSASLNSITVGTASYVSGSNSIITNLTASNISASGTGSFGRVGIGTTAPNSTLDVVGSIYLTGNIRNGWNNNQFFNVAQFPNNASTSPTYYMGLESDATNRILYINNKNGDGAATDPTGSIIFRTGLTLSDRMMISYAGNVGIGTTSPVNKLDVAGNISCSVMSSSFAYLSNIGFTNQITSSDTTVFPTGSTSGGFILDGGIYTNGLYRTRFVKIDRSANLPLYIQETQGSSGSFANLVRFGTHANSPNTFEVFGRTNIQGSITSSNFVGPHIGNTTGTASWATNALTASFLPVGTYNITSSWANNSISASYAVTASYVNISSSNVFLQGGNSFGTTALLGTNDAQPLVFETSGSERMRIVSDGNVGIGTTSPSQKLHVSSGNILLDNTYAIYAKNTVGSLETVLYGRFTDNAAYLDGGSGGLYLRSNNNTALYINPSGNLGVGGFFANNKMVVSGSVSIGDGTYNTAGPTNGLIVQGNVGIGTTSPFSGAELDVYGDIVLANQNWSLRGNNGNGDFAIEELGASFNDSNIKFYIVSGGNVGIGTIVPTQKLEVQGNVQIGNDNVTNVGLKLTRLNGGFRTSEHTFHSSQNSPWYTYGQNLTWTNELAGTVEPTQAYRPYFEGFVPAVGYKVFGFMNVNTGSFTSANVVNSLVLKNDGNVGIGTTNPAFLLDVSGSSRHGFTSTNTHQFTGSVSLSDGLSLTNLTASNISASGNIIASRITSSNVLINGNLTVTGSIFASLFSASYIYITSSTLVVTDNIITLNALSPYQRYAGMEMYDSGSGNLSSFLWDGQGDYFFITGSGVNGKLITGPDGQTDLTSNYVPKATAGYKLGNSLIYDDGTNIGIGTPTPIQKLHVVGSTLITNNNYHYGYTLAGAQSNLIGISSADNILVGQSNVNHANTIIYGGLGVIDLNTSGSTRMRVTYDGNVGIGTTSPVTLLTVGSTTTTTSSMTLQGEYQSSVFNNTNIFNFRHGGFDRWRLITVQNSAASNDFDFRINSLNSATTDYNAYVTVKGLSGNVGIGVTNPSGRLHITASATNGESLVYLSKGSGSISQDFITAVNESSQTSYKLNSDVNGYTQQTLYRNGTAYVALSAYWSNYINNANYSQGGLNLGSSGLTHGYGLTIARPATSGSLYVSGSSVFTGSVGISGSINLSGPIIYDNAVLLDFGRTTTPAISTNYVVLQNITGSYNAAFFDYFASSASNFRAGTVIAGWSGSSINYTEYSTTDIGNTNQLTMSVDLSSSFVRLLTTVSTTTNWNIKSSGRYL